MKTLITKGQIVTASDTFMGDLLLVDDRIEALATHIDAEADERIDASGKLVIPGGIDVHTHFQLPVKGTVSADSFASGSKSGAFGGVTTYIDFVHPLKGESLGKALDARIAEAHGESFIDFGFHMAISEFTDSTLDEVRECVERGVPSFKLYMIYAKEGWMSNDAVIFAMLQTVKELGGIVLVHAENPYLIDFLTDKLREAGKQDIPYLPHSRPGFTEIEAIRRALYLTEVTGSRIYIVHVSTGEGAALVAQAKGRGVSAFAETCPQYLALTQDIYSREDGYLFTSNPPLRTETDQLALWKGLSMGALQVVSTDHCSFTREQKEKGRGNFTDLPNGLPGIETLLPLTFSLGVKTGRLSLNQWVDCISTNPARMFGLYPLKGTLTPGAHADVVIFDPSRTMRITGGNLHYNVDYSPYEGMEVTGWPAVTISRGKVLVRDGEFFGEKGWGKFVERVYA